MAQQVPEAFDRSNRILRRREVEHIVGLSRSALYRRIAEKSFPQPVPLGGGAGSHAVGWLSSEVSKWLAACIAARDKAAQ
jgi:prophage regulatory protein